MNPVPSPLTPIEAIDPLLRQVEYLRRDPMEKRLAILRQAAWSQGYIAGSLDALRLAQGGTMTTPNPYDFVPSSEGSNPAPGNPEACTNTPPA